MPAAGAAPAVPIIAPRCEPMAFVVLEARVGWSAMVRAGLTPAEIQALPAVVDLVTAGAALGLGRTKTYALARAGEFPCRLIRVGKSYLVPTAELLTLLGLPATDTRREPDNQPGTGPRPGPPGKE